MEQAVEGTKQAGNIRVVKSMQGLQKRNVALQAHGGGSGVASAHS